MKIIMLAGKPNSGKTTTLIEVYKQLTKTDKEPKRNFKSYDIEYVIPYKKKKVAIFSHGDVLTTTYEVIISYCGIADVLIIAHNTNGNARKQLVQFMKSVKQHHVIIKKSRTNADNASACRSIISKI